MLQENENRNYEEYYQEEADEGVEQENEGDHRDQEQSDYGLEDEQNGENSAGLEDEHDLYAHEQL